MRLTITVLLWPEAKTLLNWHKNNFNATQNKTHVLEEIKYKENNYRRLLLPKLAQQKMVNQNKPDVQMVFCIDVRSEPFRRSIESLGRYETFGFAGFFGIPVDIHNSTTFETYSSCPVLLSPKHRVTESPGSCRDREQDQKGYERLVLSKKFYQSMKYAFTTPFSLVESLGFFCGLWMGLRCLTPKWASKLKNRVVETLRPSLEYQPSLENISFEEQCLYALNALTIMGLTRYFAPLVVLCGHGSTTQNNAYATALDCGACGGRHGASNARLLSAILNRVEVRNQLLKNGINIPSSTRFVAGEHNTTTDEVTLYGEPNSPEIHRLKIDLAQARMANNQIRLQKLTSIIPSSNVVSRVWLRSQDWAQVRPEWGLARNCAFIVAPREMTASLDLDGRCFLHSYDYNQDPEGSSLGSF